jgi:hypothetical protein
MPIKAKQSAGPMKAKKATAKVAAKKTAPKKAAATTPSELKKKRAAAPLKSAGLICASDEHCFWTTDGNILKSLEDLVFAFGSMDDTVFVYHADGVKNDFADWVEHVLEDAACAADLRKTASPKKAHTVAKKHLKKYA